MSEITTKLPLDRLCLRLPADAKHLLRCKRLGVYDLLELIVNSLGEVVANSDHNNAALETFAQQLVAWREDVTAGNAVQINGVKAEFNRFVDEIIKALAGESTEIDVHLAIPDGSVSEAALREELHTAIWKGLMSDASLITPEEQTGSYNSWSIRYDMADGGEVVLHLRALIDWIKRHVSDNVIRFSADVLDKTDEKLAAVKEGFTDALNKKAKEVSDSLKGEIADTDAKVREDIGADLGTVREELNTGLDGTKSELNIKIEKVREDMTAGLAGKVTEKQLLDAINESKVAVSAEVSAATDAKLAAAKTATDSAIAASSKATSDSLKGEMAENEQKVKDDVERLNHQMDTMIRADLIKKVNDTEDALNTKINATKTALEQKIADEAYRLPAATAEVMGGVKIGAGIAKDENGAITTSLEKLGIGDVIAQLNQKIEELRTQTSELIAAETEAARRKAAVKKMQYELANGLWYIVAYNEDDDELCRIPAQEPGSNIQYGEPVVMMAYSDVIAATGGKYLNMATYEQRDSLGGVRTGYLRDVPNLMYRVEQASISGGGFATIDQQNGDLVVTANQTGYDRNINVYVSGWLNGVEFGVDLALTQGAGLNRQPERDEEQ